MNPDALVGQLFTVDFSGPEPSDEIERLIVDGGVGGVILFDKNVEGPGQIARLTNALQRLASEAGHPPLLVSVDQEGGPVVRLRGTWFPSAMAFGAAADETLAARAAEATARELRAAGIHLNFAPVLDVNSNPANPVIGVRSYGEDPARVARLGVAAIAGTQSAGVLATAKHFPGHGDTLLDSHLALPIVSHRRDRLDAVELLPFREAVHAGVAAVMTAHVVYPALDPDHPATLSARIIALLRKEWGFGGLVVSDSMRMQAIAGRHAPGDAAVQAVRAGVDVVLALGAVEAQWEALDAVRAAARDGRIPAGRIREAAERIGAAKRRLGLFDRARVSEADAERLAGCPSHLALADQVAAAAATLVVTRDGIIPLPPGPVYVAAGLASRETTDRLAGALHAAGRPATTVALDGDGRWEARGSGRGAIVVPIGGAIGEDPSRRDRVRQVTQAAARQGPTVAVAVDVPYPLTAVDPTCACLAVYGADPASLKAAADVLAGTVPAQGRLPVTVRFP
ncbi:MAG TPA: beta-N-acetylhexosaminidase [bacterium]|nr:beta-N-acetylhexosaminidase [bacterium]